MENKWNINGLIGTYKDLNAVIQLEYMGCNDVMGCTDITCNGQVTWYTVYGYPSHWESKHHGYKSL